jgi:hypothetical protein
LTFVRGFCYNLIPNRKGYLMGKHHDKILASLEVRKNNVPQRGGYNMPGSMNKKKTGYVKRGVKR